MKPYTMYLEVARIKELEKIGKAKGLKVSQLVRVAIAEYIDRERKSK